MHNYKGNLRREYQQDYTPTKSSWEQTRENLPQRHQSRNQHRYQQKPESRYDSRVQIKNESKYEPKYEKSELSYYQSQSSRVYYEFDPSDRPSTKSQVALGEDKYSYNRVLPVHMKSLERDLQDHILNLRIQIQERVEKNQRQINIYLTDDANPKFLWMFTIKEIDFMNLKSEQKLKVSYNGFPEMLQNCLRQCQIAESNEASRHFLALTIKKGGQGKLSFIQSTKYKQSTHLQFNFKLASDEQIKDYLSVKLLSASEEIQQNRITIRNMEHTLNQRMKEIQRKNMDLNSILAERDQMKDQFKLQLNQKRTQLQSNKLNELTKVKKEGELQIKQLKQKLTSEVQILTKQKTDLSNKLSQAKERVSMLQSNQREQTMKILRLQNDYNKSNKQSEQLRMENRQLSEKRFQNQKSITELTCKIESLRSQLQDKKTIINSTVQLKQTNNSQISALQQQTADQKKQIIRLQNKISQLQADVLKLTTNNNQYIQKISTQKQKLKERGEILKEQQKDIKDLQKKELLLERQNQKLQHQKEDKENKIRSLQDQLEKMQKKFEDEQAMVAYLQKNLNERPGLRTPNYYPTNTYQASSSYSGLNRQLPSQLSTNSNIGSSRIAVTNTIPNQRLQKQKYQPNIKRYEDRSKSPLQTRLPQQKEPEEEEQSYSERPTKFQKPYPVKFKMSQPKQ